MVKYYLKIYKIYARQISSNAWKSLAVDFGKCGKALPKLNRLWVMCTPNWPKLSNCKQTVPECPCTCEIPHACIFSFFAGSQTKFAGLLSLGPDLSALLEACIRGRADHAPKKFTKESCFMLSKYLLKLILNCSKIVICGQDCQLMNKSLAQTKKACWPLASGTCRSRRYLGSQHLTTMRSHWLGPPHTSIIIHAWVSARVIGRICALGT